MDPNCSLAIHNRAVTFAQRNQFAAALRDFNRVIELNPGLAVAYRNRAELLAALGRMEEAVADYNQAIASCPKMRHCFRARAHAYQRLGDFTHATADINRAIQIAPHDPERSRNVATWPPSRANSNRRKTIFARRSRKIPIGPMPIAAWPGCRQPAPIPTIEIRNRHSRHAEKAAKLVARRRLSDLRYASGRQRRQSAISTKAVELEAEGNRGRPARCQHAA